MPKCILVIILFVVSLTLNAEARVVDERVYLVPTEKVDRKVLEAIKQSLPGYFPITVKVEIAPQEKIPEAAYNPSRNQYNAQAVLNDIFGKITLDVSTEVALIVTDVDLYSQELNFVFGIADKSKATCIISLARLRNEFYGLKPDNSLFLKRTVKEAVHELGHTWGLDHCHNLKCVMYFSDKLSDTDKKESSFCQECRKNLFDRFNSPFYKGSLF